MPVNTTMNNYELMAFNVRREANRRRRNRVLKIKRAMLDNRLVSDTEGWNIFDGHGVSQSDALVTLAVLRRLTLGKPKMGRNRLPKLASIDEALKIVLFYLTKRTTRRRPRYAGE